MHPLLQRQLARWGHGADDGVTAPPALIEAVGEAYEAFERDRALLERALDLSSAELAQANAEMRAIFDALPDAFMLVEDRGTILSYRGQRLYHTDHLPESLAGTNLRDVLGTHGSAARDAVAAVSETRVALDLEVVRLVGNHVHTYEAHVLPMPKAAVLLILHDVSFQRRASIAIAESEDRFRVLVENASDIIFIVSPDATIRFASPSLDRLTGYRAEQRVGTNLLAIMHPDDRSAFVAAIARMGRAPGIHAPVIGRLRRANDTWMVLEFGGNNLISHPAINGIVLNAREISQEAPGEAGIYHPKLPLAG